MAGILGRIFTYGGGDEMNPIEATPHPGDPSGSTVDSNQDVGVRENSKDRRARIMAEQDARRGGTHAEIKAAQQDRIDERVYRLTQEGDSEVTPTPTTVPRMQMLYQRAVDAGFVGDMTDWQKSVAGQTAALQKADAPPMEIRREEDTLIDASGGDLTQLRFGPASGGSSLPSRPDHSGTKEGWDLGDLWGPNSRFNRYREDKAAELESLPVTEKEQKQAFNKMASMEGPTPWSDKGSPEIYHSEGQRDAVQIDQIQKWIGNHGGFGAENSEQIKTLQGKLKKMGFYKGDIDGTFGPQSLKALRLFQSGRGATDEEYDNRMSSYT